MNMTSLGATLDERDSISLWATQSAGSACLVIDARTTYWEIQLDRAHVEALRHQLPRVLADLDQRIVDQNRSGQAETTRQHAEDVAAQALHLAATADQSGAPDLAAALRQSAAEASARATAVDTHLQAVDDAATEADQATEKLLYVMNQTSRSLHHTTTPA